MAGPFGHKNANFYGHLDVARKQSIADKMGSLFPVLSSNDGVRKLLENRRFSERKQKKKKSRNPSVFVDKAVSQIIIAAESAMGEKLSCKATD